MKSTLLAIAMTAATMPFTFAAQAPVTSTNPTAKVQTMHKAKRHHKKSARPMAAKASTNAALPHQK